MKEHHNNLDEFIKSLKDEPVPTGPPQKAVDATIASLADAAGQTHTETPGKRIKITERLKAVKSLTKIAAAAILLIVAGYVIGRLSAPRPPDVKQLHTALEASLKSSLEPVVRRNVVEQLNRDWQLALADSFVQLKAELNEQFRNEMSEFAVQTLAASSTVTNQLLTDLIVSINAAQTQDRRWVAAALDQIELNRMRDSTQLRNDLATFAVLTEDELLRTRQDVAEWITYSQPRNFVPNESKTLNPSNERSEK
jgi:hypothetical protein